MMPYKTATTSSSVSKRKLKSHTKSRTGCRNCKIRRVKCDETKPSCIRCESYGVSCSFGGNNLLELKIQNTLHAGKTTSLLEFSRCSPITTMLGMVNKTLENCNMSIAHSPSTTKMELDDLACLERFQNRTVLSLGTSITGQVYQQQIIKLVCRHPYLIHAVMTITYMHDRYLKDGVRSKRSLAESYHYGQAASLFRQKLSTDIPVCDHDGLWATCALLGSISFFAMDSNTANESWPLKDTPSDLEWLEVLEGIHAVWAIIKPTRSGSAFEGLLKDRSKEYLLTGRSSRVAGGASDIPPAFVALCGVDDSSTATNNPYWATLHNLSPLLNMTCDQNTFLCFLTFTGHMDSAFKQLLQIKDPRSLLILAYWYAKLCYVAPWFMATRASLECQAICMYLERYHAHRKDIQDLLHFPKAQCGLMMEPQSLTPFSTDLKEIPAYMSICV